MKTISEKLKVLDAELVEAAKPIKVLSHLNWPPTERDKFLESWRKGKPKLPKPKYEPTDFKETKKALSQIIKKLDTKDPIAEYLSHTAQSYLLGAKMIDAIGTSTFGDISKEIYGTPSDKIFLGKNSHVDAAKRFSSSTASYSDICRLTEDEYCLLPQAVIDDIKRELSKVFFDREISVVLDEHLAAKAAAGAERIRIRASTSFSQTEVAQLIEHECLVHTLTAINGRAQTNLKSLGLGAPRTTRTQEGIAVFAELITHTMDINRLRRIAMRVIAVDMGVQGANFLEVFEFFLESGLGESEAFQSTFRVFRGGNVEGGVVFTKDGTYLAGLTEVHTFLRKAIQNNKVHFPHYLVSGRLTLSDVFLLEPYFESGAIEPPRYEPRWITNRPQLAAFLLYSTFLNTIQLDNIELEHFRQL